MENKKIIIVGVGKLGEFFAKTLVKDHHEVTLVDKDFSFALDIINNEDLNYICGNGLEPDVLIEVGIKEADLLISVMQEDENNIICCLLGKKLGADKTIARIRNNEYANALKYFGEDLGLSMVINPDQLAADMISRVINIPRAIDASTFLKGRILLISLKVKEVSNLLNNSINVITKKFKGQIIICAVERNGETIIPTGSTKLMKDDKIYITGTLKDINVFLKFDNIITNTGSFMYLYFITLFLIIFIICFDGVDLSTSINATFTTFGNVGLCFDIGSFSDFSFISKLVMSIGMLLGRLEIFPIIVLFSRNYK